MTPLRCARLPAASVVCLTFVLVASSGSATKLNLLESDDLKITYPGPAFSYLVRHVAACSENALRFHEDLYDYTPSEDITIFLEDFQDFGHGGANTVPDNIVNFGVAPFSYVYETVPGIDRMFWMANHEMAHVVTMDQAADRDELYRKLFRGKVEPIEDNPLSIVYNYLTTPRWNAPRWYHEGIAVFLETWMSGGLGRAQGGYDEMVFRSMVQDGSHFYDVVGLESEGTTVDFQVGVNSYLYGTRFMSYLAYRYGPEKLIDWTARQPGSKPHFAAQFRKVYGATLAEEWSRWIEWEHEWQQMNLEAVRKNPVTPFEPITAQTLGSVSRTFLDPDAGKLYLAYRYPGQMARIATLDLEDGSVAPIATIKGPALFYVTSLAYDPVGRTLFFTSDNNGWRDLNALDLETGATRLLQKDLRTGDLAFNPADRSLWGVRHIYGISTLIRIPHPYQKWEQIHSWPYGQDIYDIDISPDGSTLAGAVTEVSGRQRLIKISIPALLTGEGEEETLFDFQNSSPANFAFSPDGRSLYGTSYYSGVSNVYRYDLEASDIFILTNAETGFFRPAPVDDERLLVFRYSGEGLVPGFIPNEVRDRVGAVRFLGNAIAREHPIVQEWHAGSPADIDPGDLPQAKEAGYSTVGSMKLQSIYPIIEGYKDSGAAGLRFNFADGLNVSNLALTLSYSPDDDLEDSERLHAALDFNHWNWQLIARYNGGDFYDLFGPTKRSRKGYSLGLAYDKTLLYDEPRTWRLKPAISFHGDLETLPDFQNIEAPADKLLSGSVQLEYEYLRHSLGAVDHEAGVRWELIASGNYADSELQPLLFSNLDYGWLLPLDHSSIWLRSSVGQSFGDADNAFGQFFFGGFGNNWVDRLGIKRYREYYSFPGIDLNEVGGENYGKLMLEWTLPPIRFRQAGVPSLYLNWARLALFSSALKTNLDDSSISRELTNIGLQVDLRTVMFSNLSTTLSFGYAVAKEGSETSDEFMVSLKIL
jgi:hypothetical protein